MDKLWRQLLYIMNYRKMCQFCPFHQISLQFERGLYGDFLKGRCQKASSIHQFNGLKNEGFETCNIHYFKKTWPTELPWLATFMQQHKAHTSCKQAHLCTGEQKNLHGPKESHRTAKKKKKKKKIQWTSEPEEEVTQSPGLLCSAPCLHYYCF